MRGLLKGIIALLIILGVVKTFQDHDVMNEANYYYNQAKTVNLFKIYPILILIIIKTYI